MAYMCVKMNLLPGNTFL